MNTCYIVYLKGENVHGGFSIQGVIASIQLDYIFRKYIKKEYGIEFEDKSSKTIPGYWEFRNITDNKDVTLIIVKSTLFQKEGV